jgi:hypothetical protein
MIDSAPENEPTQAGYPTKLAYLKAKLRWQLAKKYSSAPSSGIVESMNGEVPND